MLNTNLLSFRNVLVIALIALAWQLIFARVTAWLGQPDRATADA